MPGLHELLARCSWSVHKALLVAAGKRSTMLEGLPTYSRPELTAQRHTLLWHCRTMMVAAQQLAARLHRRHDA